MGIPGNNDSHAEVVANTTLTKAHNVLLEVHWAAEAEDRW